MLKDCSIFGKKSQAEELPIEQKMCTLKIMFIFICWDITQTSNGQLIGGGCESSGIPGIGGILPIYPIPPLNNDPIAPVNVVHRNQGW